jgi:hypothetical protein
MAIQLEQRPEHHPDVAVVVGDQDGWFVVRRNRGWDATQRSPLSTIPFEF